MDIVSSHEIAVLTMLGMAIIYLVIADARRKKKDSSYISSTPHKRIPTIALRQNLNLMTKLEIYAYAEDLNLNVNRSLNKPELIEQFIELYTNKYKQI